jgi:hypothetical protein
MSKGFYTPEYIANIIASDNSAIKRSRNNTEPDDELCTTCDHTRYYHLYGARICGMSVCHCPCVQFVPSGRFYDYEAAAQEAAQNVQRRFKYNYER